MTALASAAAISPQTVLNIESGATIPRLDTVGAIAEVLQVSAAWLAYEVGPTHAAG